MFPNIDKTNKKAGREGSQTDRRPGRSRSSWFDPPLTIGHDLDGKRRIECERLPVGLRHADARMVECIGSLDSAALIDHIAASGAVTLVAPDSCASCPLGGSAEPPGQGERAMTAVLLTEMGLAAQIPIVERQAGGQIARDDSAARRRARRGFLRRIAGSAGPPVEQAADTVAQRQATLQALRRLAAAFGVGLPPRFFPALSASDRCAGHGVCVASCATQALRWYEADGLRGVEFNAERCTACGDCVERCPEQALGLQANGNGMVPAGAVRLSGHALRCCARCEDEFMTDGDEAFCPGCRKDVGLFHDLAGAAGAGATENEEIKTEEMT